MRRVQNPEQKQVRATAARRLTSCLGQTPPENDYALPVAEPTWVARDLPVLDAVVSLLDEGADPVEVAQIVERTGLDPRQVRLALSVLAEPPTSFLRLASNQSLAEPIDFVFGATHEARRAVGSWPTPEAFADELIARLQRVADDTEAAPEVRERAKVGLKAFVGIGRDVLVGVAGSVLSAGIVGS